MILIIKNVTVLNIACIYLTNMFYVCIYLIVYELIINIKNDFEDKLVQAADFDIKSIVFIFF